MRFSCTAGADAIRRPDAKAAAHGGPSRTSSMSKRSSGRRRLLALEARLALGRDLVAREARLVLGDRLGRGGGGLVEVLRREVRASGAGGERHERPAGALHAREQRGV